MFIVEILEEPFQQSTVAAITEQMPEGSPGGRLNSKRIRVHVVDE